MISYNDIIQSYCNALLENDYQIMIDLFSRNARVFGALAGEKPVPEFYQNLFKASNRTTDTYPYKKLLAESEVLQNK